MILSEEQQQIVDMTRAFAESELKPAIKRKRRAIQAE